MAVLARRTLAFILAAAACAPPASAQSQWTVQDSGKAIWLSDVAWTGSRLVAVGDTGVVAISSDGLTWQWRRTGIPCFPLRRIIWTGRKLVAVGGCILESEDGLTWFVRDSVKRMLADVAWSGEKFLAVGYQGAILSSPDGRAWQPESSGVTAWLTAVAWTGSRFVAGAAGDYRTVLTSPDGATWTRHEAGSESDFKAIIYAGSRLVSVGTDFRTSEDGISWRTHPVAADGAMESLVWNGRTFLAVGIWGGIFASPDGMAWSKCSSYPGWNLYGAAWTGSMFVAVGDGGVIVTSPEDASASLAGASAPRGRAWRRTFSVDGRRLPDPRARLHRAGNRP